MLIRKLCRRRRRRQVWERNSVHGFPVVRWHHLNRVPGTAIKKRAIRAFADTFLATNAEIWIDFDAAEGGMVLVGYPEHARFNWAILDAGGRAGAARAAVSRDSKYARLLLTSRFAVAFRHGPMFFYDVVHIRGQRSEKNRSSPSNQNVNQQLNLT